jgi:hypothetical protein
MQSLIDSPCLFTLVGTKAPDQARVSMAAPTAKPVASERGFKLLAVTMLGSALVFFATIAGAGPKPPTPRAIGAPRLLAIALMRLKGAERRITAAQ